MQHVVSTEVFPGPLWRGFHSQPSNWQTDETTDGTTLEKDILHLQTVGFLRNCVGPNEIKITLKAVAFSCKTILYLHISNHPSTRVIIEMFVHFAIIERKMYFSVSQPYKEFRISVTRLQNFKNSGIY